MKAFFVVCSVVAFSASAMESGAFQKEEQKIPAVSILNAGVLNHLIVNGQRGESGLTADQCKMGALYLSVAACADKRWFSDDEQKFIDEVLSKIDISCWGKQRDSAVYCKWKLVILNELEGFINANKSDQSVLWIEYLFRSRNRALSNMLPLSEPIAEARLQSILEQKKETNELLEKLSGTASSSLDEALNM